MQVSHPREWASEEAPFSARVLPVCRKMVYTLLVLLRTNANRKRNKPNNPIRIGIRMISSAILNKTKHK